MVDNYLLAVIIIRMVDNIPIQALPDHSGRVFAALACATRRSILERLAAEGPQRVIDLARPFEQTKQAISKHLKVLEDADLIQREVRGREHRCSLHAAPMDTAVNWLEQYRIFWESHLESLDSYLKDQMKNTDETSAGNRPGKRNGEEPS